jgi:hypothetical protein
VAQFEFILVRLRHPETRRAFAAGGISHRFGQWEILRSA